MPNRDGGRGDLPQTHEASHCVVNRRSLTSILPLPLYPLAPTLTDPDLLPVTLLPRKTASGTHGPEYVPGESANRH